MNPYIEGALKKIQDKLQHNFKKVGGGSRFFGGAKRGEALELSAELNSNDKERQKNALKRVIANMTLGRDVSQLFTDVVKLGQTTNLELKKLVYLYVLNTAKMQPEKALMAVNTFLQDSYHQSPIIRALALRTMMCIRIDSVTEYTLEPLRKATKDSDPYVRKSAAVGLGKLFHQSPRLFEEQGFMDDLMRLMNDNISVVSSNAAIILSEIRAVSGAVTVQVEWVSRLLNSLSESTEWAQCFFLDLLSTYQPATPQEAETIIERVVARLSHTNPAVVLGAVKIIAAMLPICNSEALSSYVPRINSAMLTLIKGDVESQYIVCKNVQVLLRLFPTLLSNNVDSFFIRFTDPPYVKKEKLFLLLKLTTQSNANQVLKELAEYSTEVDIIFTRAVVQTMAAVALKVESVAPRVVEQLLGLVEKRPELLPDVTNAAKSMMRKYPDLCLDLVAPLINKHGAHEVVEEEAKVSVVWMLGEFCDVIENGQPILQEFLANFNGLELAVQLALLTAVVKIFLRNPSAMAGPCTNMLQTVTDTCSNPDLRDRALMYFRLLAKGIGVERMKQIVHGWKPPVDAEQSEVSAFSGPDATAIINSAAAVYAKPPRVFLPKYGIETAYSDDDDDFDEEIGTEQENPVAAAAVAAPTAAVPEPAPAPKHSDPLDSLFGGPSPVVAPAPTAAPALDPFAPAPTAPVAAPPAAAPAPANLPPNRASASFDDIFGGPSPTAAPAQAPPAGPVKELVLDPARTGGLRMSVALVMDETTPTLALQLENVSTSPITDIVMQLNKSAFGLVPSSSLAQCMNNGVLPVGVNTDVSLPLRASDEHFDANKLAVEAGIQSSLGLHFFTIPVSPAQFFIPAPGMQKAEFANAWRALDDVNEAKMMFQGAANFARAGPARVQELLGAKHIAVVATTTNPGKDAYFCTVKTRLSITAMVEIVVSKDGMGSSHVSVKCLRSNDILPSVAFIVETIAREI